MTESVFDNNPFKLGWRSAASDSGLPLKHRLGNIATIPTKFLKRRPNTYKEERCAGWESGFLSDYNCRLPALDVRRFIA